MSHLPALLKKLEALHRQQIAVERQILEIEREIVAAGKPATKRRKRTVGPEAVALVRATVKTLQEAGEPLPRQEIAARLGIKPVAVDYRLRKAIAAGFVEKVGRRYRAVAEIPAL